MASEIFEGESLSLELTSFLDKNVGTEKSSAASIKSLLQDVLKKKKCLETELQEARSRTPDKIQDVLDKGCSAVNEIKNLQQQHEQLTSRVDSHLKKLHPLAEHLSSLVSQIAEVERFRAYVSWIQKIESVSCRIHQFVEAGQLNWAVEQLSVLSELAQLLSESACCNLTKFVKEMQLHWRNILLNKLASEFDEIMKALKWPFTALSTAPPLSTTSDDYSRLETVFILLLKLQKFKEISTGNTSLDENKSEILLPLDWLLKPFRKRFRFHFYGNKQTNNPQKPEWYFTQVLNWIKNHSDFLEHTIQPILQRTEYDFVCAKTEFISGLLKVVVEKLEHSIPFIIDDDGSFSHFVDELLLFNKELHVAHNYSSTEYVCLHVLTTEACLQRWVHLERSYAESNMNSILSSSSAWTPKYKEVGDVDDTRTPECAEGFITLLSVITDRYRNLPNVKHQERFLEVQLFLLESFISRLKLEAGETSSAPAGLHYCSVLNTANYVNLILQEWSEQMLFLKLCEHRNQSNGYVKSGDSLGMENHEEDTEVFQERGILSMRSVFEEVTQSLLDLQEHMISDLVKHVVQGFRMLSKPYKKEKWHTFPSPKDVILLTLSSSACEMLLFLKGRFQILREQLASTIFSVIWKNLAKALNKFIYNEIILECHFNEGGAAQLQFDLTKNLFTLFLEYTQKPENFFKE
ncbi:RAD50-interacting protein 1-like [Stylophora pistillata]|nr:RAD50-interacting protein 1-like [Stylophora pistillata]